MLAFGCDPRPSLAATEGDLQTQCIVVRPMPLPALLELGGRVCVLGGLFLELQWIDLRVARFDHGAMCRRKVAWSHVFVPRPIALGHESIRGPTKSRGVVLHRVEMPPELLSELNRRLCVILRVVVTCATALLRLPPSRQRAIHGAKREQTNGKQEPGPKC